MTEKKTRTIILTALLAALTTVATMVIRIPTPTLGYIHLGDGMVLICGILLGPGLGAAAAGIGSMLADLFAGAVAYMPGTLVIKALTALVGGWVYHRLAGHASLRTPVRVALAGIPAELVMVAGYFVYEAGMQIVAGSAVGAAAAAMLAGVPFNIVQGLAGIIVGAVLLPVLSHASAEMDAASKPETAFTKTKEPFCRGSFFMPAPPPRPDVEQDAAAELGVPGVLGEEIAGSPQLLAKRGARRKTGQG